MKIIKENAKSDTVFYFSKIPSYKDYFIYLKEHRNLVIELLDDCLNVEIKNNLFKGDSSGIGIHIRMGDFRKLNENEKFVGGHVRTPEKYFVSVINKIRKFIGSDFPAVVFTDGYTEEFDDLKKMNAVTFHESKYDIVDLLNLSKCRIIVTSQGSTFSYWAGFLSNASVIHHPEHIHQKTRKVELGLYEGEFNENEFKLIQSLEKLKDIYS